MPREVVDRLLVTAGLAGTEPAAIPGAFDELVRRFAAMRDALQQQRNDDPEIATLKQQASDALAPLIWIRPSVCCPRSARGNARCRRRAAPRRGRSACRLGGRAGGRKRPPAPARPMPHCCAWMWQKRYGFYQDGIAVLADAFGGDPLALTHWPLRMRCGNSATVPGATMRSSGVSACTSLPCATQTAIGCRSTGR